MAHNKLYRNFIILQEDERGYSHSNDKALSGYAKVEAKGDKCKVSFYAQNLKQEDNYSMVLICCKRDLKQLIDLGPLSINEVGKGDTSKEYYVNNIAGIGMSYEKISGAAICKVKDNETEFIMHGFMNGEESTDNWRKFKVVKVDSKRYINKLEEGPKGHTDKFDIDPKKNEILSSGISDKVTTSQANTIEAKIVETSKLESELVEGKKHGKEIKEAGVINVENSKVEDKAKIKISENHQNINETINILDEDRNKCKEVKKHDKYDKCYKHDDCDKHDKYDECDKHDDCDKYDKYDKCDKHDDCDKLDKYEEVESIEDAINKLGKKLDNYNGVMDIKIKNMHQDIIIYGFIKDKKDCDCKWKKFKAETKCRNESQECYNIEPNSRRIEENFKLDNLNTENRLDRLDISDFDEYENKIQQAGPMGQKGETGEMGPTGQMGQKGEAGEMGPIGQMGQKGEAGEMGPTGPMGQKGEAGEMGQTGQMGQKGEAGELGPMGPMGEKGEKGEKGEMGPIGQMGQKGEIGEMGPMGPMNTQCKCETETSDTNMCKITISTMEEPEAVKKIKKCNLGNMQQATSNEGFKMNGEVGQYFEKLAEDFEPYKGSLTDINYCKLYKINVNSIEDLCDESNYNKYTLAYYPMLNYYPYISKSGNFLLGYKCNTNGEMKYIVYGIPGGKEKSDQPYGGRTGFVTWTSDDENDIGYWLMFYDFNNSSIVIPTK